MNDEAQSDDNSPRGENMETLWSQILKAAGKKDSSDFNAVWLELVNRYREPMRKMTAWYLGPGYDAEMVTDLFFSHLFERGVLGRADPERGRFRAFIRKVQRDFLAGFLIEDRRSGQALGESVDIPDPRQRDPGTTEAEYFGMCIVRNVRDALIEKHSTKAELLFRAAGIAPFKKTTYAELHRETGLTEENLRKQIQRMREQFRDLLLAEIRDIAATTNDYEQERSALIAQILERCPGLLSESDDSSTG